MTNGNPVGLELCAGSYRARQMTDTVLLFAAGVHNTGGFTVLLVQSPIRVYPPEFSLWHVKPSGEVSQVITPFSACVAFPAAEPVEIVVVHDENGRHEVAVERAPDVFMSHGLEVP